MKPKAPESRAEELRELVAAMRELGVEEYDGIRLGPDPRLKAPEVDPAVAMNERLIRQHETMFAASHVRPKLRLIQPSRGKP